MIMGTLISQKMAPQMRIGPEKVNILYWLVVNALSDQKTLFMGPIFFKKIGGSTILGGQFFFPGGQNFKGVNFFGWSQTNLGFKRGGDLGFLRAQTC